MLDSKCVLIGGIEGVLSCWLWSGWMGWRESLIGGEGQVVGVKWLLCVE